ncbi:MAG: DNA repair protein RadA [Dehalococcoidia bacterium]|nr:DNA repair protein RadA [Dehalococcoidia bacterium]
MDKSKVKRIFVCQQCGKESAKWLGRCPNCQAWNSFVETAVGLSHIPSDLSCSRENKPQELSQVEVGFFSRFHLGFAELNRVLGGGLVPGSLVLIGGEPGIGKSTLLLQALAMVAESNGPVAYVSGEESINQVKLRAERLNVRGKGFFILSETSLSALLGHLEALLPHLVVIDSIQSVYLEDASGVPGSIAQVRECTLRLMYWAKRNNVPVFITGHVTKDGAIAGPGALEHIVDVVLYFEGEQFSNYRMLRSVKNRFGPTNEVGVFEMGRSGLIEIENPSQVFLSKYKDAAIGSVVVPALEGTRPLLVEIQALITPASFGPPRRIANGIDFNRLLLISAVLSKRAGLRVSNQDIMVNVTGGLKVNEPAIDLGIALAIASSFRDSKPLSGLVALGEVGLNGELRSVAQAERRIAEAIRLGFKSCLMPRSSSQLSLGKADIQLIEASSVADALHLGLRREPKGKQ